MTIQEVKRKLVAILSADVKGYSRLMGEDEEGTIRTLNTYKEVMSDLIQQQRGRVVDAPGDNVLAEFGSVVDAVRCAVNIQRELKTRNAGLSENRRMEFRIGVNIGDVVEDGEQILGDRVNIAARLESLSGPGGICISGPAYDQVENKLSLGYKYLGEQTVKNIVKPVRVYRVLMEPGADIDREVVPISTSDHDQESGGEYEPEILAQKLVQDIGSGTVMLIPHAPTKNQLLVLMLAKAWHPKSVTLPFIQTSIKKTTQPLMDALEEVMSHNWVVQPETGTYTMTELGVQEAYEVVKRYRNVIHPFKR
jgi:class 3 adenylate cyclase